MTTLAEIVEAAEIRPVAIDTDDTTPVGTFTATAVVLGIATTYLLLGEKGDLDASILGRIEHGGSTRQVLAYVGGGLKGGSFLLTTDSEQAFKAMVAGVHQ